MRKLIKIKLKYLVCNYNINFKKEIANYLISNKISLLKYKLHKNNAINLILIYRKLYISKL